MSLLVNNEQLVYNEVIKTYDLHTK